MRGQPVPETQHLGTHLAGRHLAQVPILPQQPTIGRLSQTAVHQTDGPGILLAANQATCRLQQAVDGGRTEADIESVGTMIIPDGMTFELRGRQRQPSDDDAEQAIANQIDPLAEYPPGDGEADTGGPVGLFEGLQEMPACCLVHVRLLSQQQGADAPPCTQLRHCLRQTT